MESLRNGPVWTDYNGDLDAPVLTCTGCHHLRYHDRHYPYCSAQPVPNQSYPWPGAGKHIQVEKPNAGCPYPVPEKPADTAA